MTDPLLPFQPSLASATNTRLDTAARHMQQCRVSTDDMLRFVKDDVDELQRNKYRYCVHKDELVVGVGRPWDTTFTKRANNAYPRVISNLGALDDADESRIAVGMIRFMNHFARSIQEKKAIVEFFKNDVPARAEYHVTASWQALPDSAMMFRPRPDGKMGTRAYLTMMYDFLPVGYATTLGYAHPNTGDTMTSVLIGGLITVMNGDFEVYPGDLVQFYWRFEKDDFLPDGRRKPYLDIWDHEQVRGNVNPAHTTTVLGKRERPGDKDSGLRQAYHELSYGQKPDKHKLVAKVKPYFRDDDNPRLYDWVRVFGVAISSARPNDMVDIKISRQSA